MATKKAKPPRRAAKRPAPRKAKSAARARPTRAPDAPPPGAYSHVELYTEDPAATKRFYAEVFGWQVQDMSYGPGMSYSRYQAKAPPHGGFMALRRGPFTPPPVLTYINVQDVDEATRRIARAGGKVVVPRYDIPNVGSFAIFEAPGGIVQAVWKNHPAFRPHP